MECGGKQRTLPDGDDPAVVLAQHADPGTGLLHPWRADEHRAERLIVEGNLAFELMDPLRKLIAGGLPAFGSCAGMIMLADRLEDGVTGQQTFGGIDMTVRRNAFGRQVDSFERDIDIDGAGFRAVFIRAPWVEQAGPAVDVIAQDRGRIVAVRQGVSLATAFHPELTPDRRIHELFVSMVKGTS